MAGQSVPHRIRYSRAVIVNTDLEIFAPALQTDADLAAADGRDFAGIKQEVKERSFELFKIEPAFGRSLLRNTNSYALEF